MGIWKNIKGWFRSTTDFSVELDREGAASRIRNNIWFRGANVWILAFSIVIASVGLNVNSTAVIIGAMLISPLMGPIIGMGFSMGTFDGQLMKDALRNLLIMFLVSLAASAAYFFISPLSLVDPTELEARTSPTIYDVLIALFGGVAGMLENSRKERGTVLSGVAIATALMPPLCTVGYGIASLNPRYIFGALYLFLINGIFIALATFFMAKFLGFESVAIDEYHRRRNPRIVAAVLIIMIVPSVFSAIGTIRDNNFAISAERFVQSNKTIGSSYIFDYDINLDGRHQTLDVYLAGEQLDYTAKQILLKNALGYGIHSDQIIFHEEAAVQNINKNEVIRDLNDHYLKKLQELNQTIMDLQLELSKYKAAEKSAEKTTTNPQTPDAKE